MSCFFFGFGFAALGDSRVLHLSPRRFRGIVQDGIEVFDDFLGDNFGIGTVCDAVKAIV
jgi:hypothetical protein